MLKQLQLSMNKYGIIIVLLISIVFNSCSNNSDKRNENELSQQRQKISEMLFRGRTSEPVTVKVIEVGKSDMVSSDCFVGSVKTSHSSLVISPASGTLTDIYVREGQRIRKGQVVAKIESQQIKSAYEAAAATLRQAEDWVGERLFFSTIFTHCFCCRSWSYSCSSGVPLAISVWTWWHPQKMLANISRHHIRHGIAKSRFSMLGLGFYLV